MANIKVAVRVRPISARELKLTGSELVVRTDLKEISLTNLKVSSSKAGDSRERVRKYGFDHCFDSSDPESENFADQERIYQSLGHTILDALFSGYNSCLVAYGQSASGKTYTMMGTKEDPGLTPRFCEGVFARIEEEKQNNRNYCVSISYLEIYNERVRDLLKPSSSTSGLRVREHPRLGPYVQGLTHHAVRTLDSLMSYVEEGTRARKTASTLQNPSSSRSHAVLTIIVAPEAQIFANGVTSCTSTRRNEISPRGGSKLRLVDLAGSESAATCSGVHRLKEGANINKSLVALGNVISALAGRDPTGSGPGRRFIPYRDSSLTWLLKDALGGNATTIMLATISPASGSYNETAHTLRFAQRAQSVVNRPVVNEDPVARVIRELRAEVARLKSLLLEKNIEPDGEAIVVCSCRKNQSQHFGRAKDETGPKLSGRSATNTEETSETECSKTSRNVVAFRRSNSSDAVITREVKPALKKFGSLEWLNTGDRFRGNYNRAKVTELHNEEDEVSEIHESVFVDIPTLVAVLIKPDDNLQESTAQIEEICSDEVVEEPIDAEFIETTNRHGVFEKLDSVNHGDSSNSVASCHACGGNELDVYDNPGLLRGYSTVTSKERPKFRKQDSVDFISTSVPSNLHSSRRFGSVETIGKKKDPIFPLERSQTNLEKCFADSDRVKRLNNIREIDDQRTANRNNNWRGSKEQVQRKGSNDSDKSLHQNGTKFKNNARKPSLENLKRKTSKDSSSSSSKDEQILISSLSRDKLLHRKNSLEQESHSVRSHTPIQRAKRAEIVAAVTERLYSSRKQMEDATGIRSPPESSEVKSMARMKLQEISRKMLGKRRRVCVDTQTDSPKTVRMKDSATETPQVICQDVEVLTDDHAASEHVQEQKTPILRVKEVATLTEKPSRTNIVRYKDVGILVNDLEAYDYEIHSPRNDSGILSDDTQNYAESNMSSTDASDICHDRRVVYAESSTNTSTASSCRSCAVQTPRLEGFDQHVAQIKSPVCLRRCCSSVQETRKHCSVNGNEKSVISISLPDTINITIESMSPSLEPRIAITDCDSTKGYRKISTKDGEVQTERASDHSNEIACPKDRISSTNSQTDSRVFRIENIFQNPNNATNNAKVDRIMEGTRIRNSITFRNSLGTSYVSQPKEDELTSLGHGLHDGEGFIRDGLITETFITRKRGINSKKAPSSVVYRDSWKNRQVPVSSVNVDADDYDARKVEITCEPRIAETCNFGEAQMDEDLARNGETASHNGLTINVDHDHGFSDDSLDYNEANVSSESVQMLKSKRKLTKLRDTFCPPDVVAHTKKDCAKSPIEKEKNVSTVEFDNIQIEIPKKNPAELAEGGKIHDYKTLILGKSGFNYEEIMDEPESSQNRVSSPGKKKVSFSNFNICEQPMSKQCPKQILKSIIKKRKKKNVSETVSTVHSSNDETDDSQQEDQAGLSLGHDWKGAARSSSSEETREDQDSGKSKGNSKLNRKKVEFFVEELSENTCSESDSYENVGEEAEDDEEILPGADRNILEEYLSEAVTFMRNLNFINEYVNNSSTLKRYPPFPCRGRHGKRGTRRRSCIPDLNHDYTEFSSRKFKSKEDVDYPVEEDDIIPSTESYDRCVKSIQRLEDCIRRVDKHNELLQEKYGVDCETAGARFSLASPNADSRVPKTNSDFRVLRETDVPPDKRFDLTERKAENDDLEKKIFDQLMNVANSIRYRNSNKLRVHSPGLSDTRSMLPAEYSRLSEKHGHQVKEPFCRDIMANLSVEETVDGDDDESDYTTYEIMGNLSLGKNRNTEESDDNLDRAMDEDFLPLRRFNRSSWSPESVRGSPLTLRRDDSLCRKYRTTDIADLSRKVCNPRENSPAQWIPTDSARGRFQGADDYSRRVTDGSWRMCACSKDHSGIECASCEIVHLRDKLKYPGSPRAKFLELLRERRRIVECSRGTSAS